MPVFPPSRVRTLVLRLIAAAGLGWLICLLAIMFWSRRGVAGPADAIVVLGAAQYGGRPSPVLRSRLDHALGLWKASQAPVVVLTGGRGPGDLISEAAAGRRYLVRRGVPNSAILLESNGRTSLASIRSAAALLHDDSTNGHHAGVAGIAGVAGVAGVAGTADHPRVLLVSDPFHMLRLAVLARLHGLRPLPSPTRTSPISANRAVLEYMVRESIALPTDLAQLAWLEWQNAPSDVATAASPP
jgi:uncharacterized SAM-binding protein YcdF (DUF218 family)